MYSTKINFAVACILFFCLLNRGCTKIDNTTIGASLLPAVDNINTFDTIIPVIANNYDSVSKDCAKIYPPENHVLGYISNDPYFGTSLASVYVQLLPPFFPYFLPDTASNVTLDSVVLVLSYKSLYGDSTALQKVNVYQVSTANFKFDSSTCTTQTYNSELLGSATYIPERLKDSVKAFRDTSKNQLRINLSKTFGESILAQDFDSGFKSDTLFNNFFKGFAVVPDVDYGNALTYYSLTDTNTKLALYYRYSKGSIIDSAVVTNFRLAATSASANSIVRNHDGAEIALHKNRPPEGDDVIFIQTTPGTYAELKIPGLTGLGNRIVHRAELVMDQVYSPSSLDEYFTPPRLLNLEIISNDTLRRPIPCDFNTLSGQPNIATFGGLNILSKDAFGNSISRYTFNITRYVQKIITNLNKNYTLKLSAPDFIANATGYVDECSQGVSPYNLSFNPLTVGRVKLTGGNNSNPALGMRLRIIYSKL